MSCPLTSTPQLDGTYVHSCGECSLRTTTNKPALVYSCRPQSEQPEQPELPCIFRGARIGSERCTLCGKRGEWEATFKCAVHGRCSLRKFRVNQRITTCVTCPDRVEPSVSLPQAGSDTTFDRVVCINLDRRPERWAEFAHRLPRDWPFPAVRRFSAVDGKTSPKPPKWFTSGKGAWGCYSSHLQILSASQGESLLVLEDDAEFVVGFAQAWQTILPQLPTDWDMLYLGGQHLRKRVAQPIQLSANVVIPFNVNRTHAYAVRGEMIQYLIDWLTRQEEWQPRHHIDHHLGRLLERLYETQERKAYAVSPWIVGQRGGKSDVSAKNHASTRFWR